MRNWRTVVLRIALSQLVGCAATVVKLPRAPMSATLQWA
jgi:hypothetical protein